MKPLLSRWCAVGALALAAPVNAEKLVYVVSSEAGTDYYYDADTVRISGNIITVWEVTDSRKDKSADYPTTKARITYDCGEGTYSLIHLVYYGYKGELKLNLEFPVEVRKFNGLIPGTAPYEKSKVVCALRL